MMQTKILSDFISPFLKDKGNKGIIGTVYAKMYKTISIFNEEDVKEWYSLRDVEDRFITL